MKKLLSWTAAVALSAAPLFAAATVGEWTGYITDTHCGQKGATSDHTAACVEKCMKGGSKSQLWNEADKKAYDLDDYSKVKGLVGQKVTIKGTMDSENHSIKVESAAKAAGK